MQVTLRKIFMLISDSLIYHAGLNFQKHLYRYISKSYTLNLYLMIPQSCFILQLQRNLTININL